MSEDIMIKKSTFNKLIIGITSALVIAAFLGGYVIGSFGGTKTVTQDNYASLPTQALTQPLPTQIPSLSNPELIMNVSINDSPVMGNPNAPITMIEFSDFQCPFCSRFFSHALSDIEKNYIDSGKVRLVYKNFPLENLHPNAMAAAISAECANEQGKFWEYHDTLFENQTSWAQLNATDASKTFKQYASESGLDANSFKSCLDSGKYTDKVNKDQQDGSQYGVNGTPTFFIGNDKKGYAELDGDQPFSAFQKELDSELG